MKTLQSPISDAPNSGIMFTMVIHNSCWDTFKVKAKGIIHDNHNIFIVQATRVEQARQKRR